MPPAPRATLRSSARSFSGCAGAGGSCQTYGRRSRRARHRRRPHAPVADGPGGCKQEASFAAPGSALGVNGRSTSRTRSRSVRTARRNFCSQGEAMTAAEAHAIGMVNRVRPPGPPPDPGGLDVGSSVWQSRSRTAPSRSMTSKPWLVSKACADRWGTPRRPRRLAGPRRRPGRSQCVGVDIGRGGDLRGNAGHPLRTL